MHKNKRRQNRIRDIYFSYKNSRVTGYSASKKRTKYEIKLEWRCKMIHWCGHHIYMPYKATIIDQVLKLIIPD